MDSEDSCPVQDKRLEMSMRGRCRGIAISAACCPGPQGAPPRNVFNPEPMNIGSAWGVGNWGRQPFWGPSLLADWLAAPCLEQQRLGSTAHNNGTKDVIT